MERILNKNITTSLLTIMSSSNTLSWCFIFGYGTCIGYIRDYKKFTVVVGGGHIDFYVSLNQINLNLDLI